MELNKTLKNLRKSKNNFFNFNGDDIINFDLCKNNMLIILDCVTYHYRERIVIYEKIFMEKWEFSKRYNDSFFVTEKPIFYYNNALKPHGHVLLNKLNYEIRGDVKFLIRLCN